MKSEKIPRLCKVILMRDINREGPVEKFMGSRGTFEMNDSGFRLRVIKKKSVLLSHFSSIRITINKYGMDRETLK